MSLPRVIDSRRKQATISLIAASILVILLIVAVPLAQVYAGTTNSAANKVAAAASTAEVSCTGSLCNGMPIGDVVLLTGTIKTSTTLDLIISVSLQCALFTTVSVKGSSTSSVVASAVVWVTIDGMEVPTTDSSAFAGGSTPGTAGSGHVVFCDRAMSLSTSGFTLTQMITLSINTTEANAFNWMAWNVGNEYGTSTTHTIKVHASVVQLVSTGTGSSAVVIGARTMIADPTSLANQISF